MLLALPDPSQPFALPLRCCYPECAAEKSWVCSQEFLGVQLRIPWLCRQEFLGCAVKVFPGSVAENSRVCSQRCHQPLLCFKDRSMLAEAGSADCCSGFAVRRVEGIAGFRSSRVSFTL